MRLAVPSLLAGLQVLHVPEQRFFVSYWYLFQLGVLACWALNRTVAPLWFWTQAAGMASYVAAYRIGMLASTAGALFIVSAFQGAGLDHQAAWTACYVVMAALVRIGVATTLSAGLAIGHLISFCKYEEPSLRSQCISSMSPGPDELTNLEYMPFYKNFKSGYTAIDGDKALIGYTGTVCVLKMLPSCFTNKDPAAILDSGKSFSAL